jgi:hypothetical protein
MYSVTYYNSRPPSSCSEFSLSTFDDKSWRALRPSWCFSFACCKSTLILLGKCWAYKWFHFMLAHLVELVKKQKTCSCQHLRIKTAHTLVVRWRKVGGQRMEPGKRELLWGKSTSFCSTTPPYRGLPGSADMPPLHAGIYQCLLLQSNLGLYR